MLNKSAPLFAHNHPRVLAALTAVSLLLAVGCIRQRAIELAAKPEAETIQTLDGSVHEARAILWPTEGNDIRGTVGFLARVDGVLITAHVTGLEPGRPGIHIHEVGDCSASDGSSAGGHFNPGGQPHGGPNNARRPAGDLGNLGADANGEAIWKHVDDRITLERLGPRSILRRAVIIHRHADDLQSQPSGDAGPRVACGVIKPIVRESDHPHLSESRPFSRLQSF